MTPPYKYAHVFVLAVLALTVLAFWPSYFSEFGTAPLAFHAHGLATSAWILLVAAQSWSIHRGATRLHRRVGMLSLLLFPVLIASFVMIINVSAERFVSGAHPFFAAAGPILGFVMLSAIGAFLLLYPMALRFRGNVRVHALCLLATVLILAESAVGRLLQQIVPSMSFDGTGNFQSALDSIAIPDLVAAAILVGLFWRDREHGLPFLLAGVLLVLEVVGIYWLAEAAWLESVFAAYAQVPQWLSVGAGFGLGAGAAWFGWSRPARYGVGRVTSAVL